MCYIVGCGGSVAEDDDGFVDILSSEQEHVEIVFAVCDWNLQMHLFERSWNREGLGVDFADE